MVYTDTVENVRLSVRAEDCIGMVMAEGISETEADTDLPNKIINPRYGKDISTLVRERKAKSASIIISDATRHVPTSVAAPVLIDLLTAAGIELENILFIVALGVHREATEKELVDFIGEKYYGKVRVINSSPYDDASLAYLGQTTWNTPVYVNREAYACDLHLAVGKVEAHPFAGFSGGRKSVLPGIAGAKTIACNHSYDNINDLYSVPGEMLRNRINLDMIEAAELYRLDFVVQFVVSESLMPVAVFAGEMSKAHEAAIDFIRPHLAIDIPEKPDIIVTTTSEPKNICFYQAVVSLSALLPVLDEGMVVVLTCECREGIDSIDMQRPFVNADSLEDVEKFMQEEYEIQMDSAVFLLKVLQKGVKIICSSPNLSDEEIRKLFMIPCREHKEIMKIAYEVSGKKHPKVLFLPHPQTGLPQANY